MSAPTLFDQPMFSEEEKKYLLDPSRFRTRIEAQITAEALRDAGIESVTRNESTWIEDAHALIARYPDNEANAEELRIFVEERLGPPHHVNAYGAMIMSAVRKGLLNNTGIYIKSSRPASHARRVPHYIINKHV